MRSIKSFSIILAELKLLSKYDSFAVKKHGGISDPSSTEESVTNNYKQAISDEDIVYLKAIGNIPYYRHLTSSKRKFGKPIIFIKRVIRKSVKFLLEDSFLRITTFNFSVSNIIERLAYQNRVTALEISSLRKENAHLYESLENLKKEIALSREDVNAKSQIFFLKNQIEYLKNLDK